MQVIQHAHIGQIPWQAPDSWLGKYNPVVVALGHNLYISAINLQNYLNFHNSKHFTPYFRVIAHYFNICYDAKHRQVTFQRLQLIQSYKAAKILFVRCLHCVHLAFIYYLILMPIRNCQMLVDSK